MHSRQSRGDKALPNLLYSALVDSLLIAVPEIKGRYDALLKKLIDNTNGGNINVLQNVGDKVVRITLDPTGSRIVSAGYMQSRNVANGIASGRFTPMK
jgi:hypothetical protein